MAPTVSYTLGNDIISQATHTPSSTSHSPSFLLYDGHGSTRLVTDSSGSITDRMNYDAYGMMLGLNPTSSAPPTTSMLYSGETFDVDLQQQYLRARWYDQNSGRFNRLDPFMGNNSDPQSLHKYSYTHNDPVNGIDPSGKFNLIDFMSAAAVRLIITVNTTFATYGLLAETYALVTTIGFLYSLRVLTTGEIPETGEPASVLAMAFAVVDIIPGGKIITKPLTNAQKAYLRSAGRNLWDTYSNIPRTGKQVHHRVPLEWAHVFPNVNPNRLSNLTLLNIPDHQKINAIWTKFRNSLQGRIPTQAEVMDVVFEVERKFGDSGKYIQVK